MSVTQPLGYAQGREPVERQMVFDGESGHGRFIDLTTSYIISLIRQR
ncbi:MAG: hypothetical protein JRI79_05655 [Deltaproteobacteria bacterium]|nr:hypothetical protein [Deltaproteobacteria bacterium]MBW1977441.1 hypothetical protein [Deltaproteobacteria bacterium]MBW2299652.1 hypothetical protein [Deltaproteobacteria bacterium]